jgi:hypothetical protein
MVRQVPEKCLFQLLMQRLSMPYTSYRGTHNKAARISGKGSGGLEKNFKVMSYIVM